MQPVDRLLATASVVVILAGFILLAAAAVAPAQSSADLQRQLDRITGDLRGLEVELKTIERHRAEMARGGFERLAAVEREMEWTRWLVRGNFGVSGGILGLLLVILRRLNGKTTKPGWDEDEQ